AGGCFVHGDFLWAVAVARMERATNVTRRKLRRKQSARWASAHAKALGARPPIPYSRAHRRREDRTVRETREGSHVPAVRRVVDAVRAAAGSKAAHVYGGLTGA